MDDSDFFSAEGTYLTIKNCYIRGFMRECISVGGHDYPIGSLALYMYTNTWFSEVDFADGDSKNLKLSNLISLGGRKSNNKNNQPTEELDSDYGLEDEPADNLNIIPDLFERNLAEELLYEDRKFYFKRNDQELVESVLIDGIERSPKEIFYFLITDEWHKNIEVLDESRGLVYGNLVHSDFFLCNIDRLSLKDFNDYLILGKDENDNTPTWKYSPKSNGLKNSILEGNLINFDYFDTKLVNWFGNIFLYSSFLRKVNEYHGLSPVTQNLDLNYSYDPVTEDEKSYGRNKLITCFYCGDDTSITRDHVVPVSSNSSSRSYNSKDTVKCCRECNLLLSNKFINTVEERAFYLSEAIANRYKKCINSADFTESEINDLGPRLSSLVTSNMVQKKYIAARISHAHKIAGGLYNPEEVSHLRGTTTYAKKIAYSIIYDFVFDNKISMDEYAEKTSLKRSIPKKEILKVLREKIHIDVSIQFKYDHRLNLSARSEERRVGKECRSRWSPEH